MYALATAPNLSGRSMQMKILKKLKLLTFFVFTGAVFLVCSSAGLACNPPFGENHYQGPAIRGYFVFEAVSETNNTLAWAFNGTCGAADIVVPKTAFDDLTYPDDITEQNLLENIIDYVFVQPYAYECEPHLKEEAITGLQIIKLNNFDNTGDAIIVDVIMLWLVPQ